MLIAQLDGREEAIIHSIGSNTYVNLKFIKCNHLTPIRSLLFSPKLTLTRARSEHGAMVCAKMCLMCRFFLEIHKTFFFAVALPSRIGAHTKERPLDGYVHHVNLTRER